MLPAWAPPPPARQRRLLSAAAHGAARCACRAPTTSRCPPRPPACPIGRDMPSWSVTLLGTNQVPVRKRARPPACPPTAAAAPHLLRERPAPGGGPTTPCLPPSHAQASKPCRSPTCSCRAACGTATGAPALATAGRQGAGCRQRSAAPCHDCPLTHASCLRLSRRTEKQLRLANSTMVGVPTRRLGGWGRWVAAEGGCVSSGEPGEGSGHLGLGGAAARCRTPMVTPRGATPCLPRQVECVLGCGKGPNMLYARDTGIACQVQPSTACSDKKTTFYSTQLQSERALRGERTWAGRAAAQVSARMLRCPARPQLATPRGAGSKGGLEASRWRRLLLGWPFPGHPALRPCPRPCLAPGRHTAWRPAALHLPLPLHCSASPAWRCACIQFSCATFVLPAYTRS